MSDEYAFPRPRVLNVEHGYVDDAGSAGITLRDYFAGKALVGMLASERPDDEMKMAEYADDSYRFADAMLKARQA